MMMSANTAMAMPSVALTSVVGTTFWYLMPMATAVSGNQSTGTRSMRFMKKIHTNSVSASGAMSLLVP